MTELQKLFRGKTLFPTQMVAMSSEGSRFVFDIENGWALLESEDAVGQSEKLQFGQPPLVFSIPIAQVAVFHSMYDQKS